MYIEGSYPSPISGILQEALNTGCNYIRERATEHKITILKFSSLFYEDMSKHICLKAYQTAWSITTRYFIDVYYAA